MLNVNAKLDNEHHIRFASNGNITTRSCDAPEVTKPEVAKGSKTPPLGSSSTSPSSSSKQPPQESFSNHNKPLHLSGGGGGVEHPEIFTFQGLKEAFADNVLEAFASPRNAMARLVTTCSLSNRL